MGLERLFQLRRGGQRMNCTDTGADCGGQSHSARGQQCCSWTSEEADETEQDEQRTESVQHRHMTDTEQRNGRQLPPFPLVP